MLMLIKVLLMIVFASASLLAVRYPEVYARFLVSSVLVDKANKNPSRTETMARTIREEGLAWRTEYADLYRYIVGSGYVGIIVCSVALCGLLSSMFLTQ